MKFKALFAALVAGAALVTSCEQPFEPTYLDAIKVSSSYVAIPEEGGSVEITLNATGDWNITGVGTGDKEIDWVTVTPMSGQAGEDIVLTFSAEANDSGRQGSIYINVGNQQQVINLIQGLVTAQTVPVSQVIEDVNNGTVGKLYRVTGIATAIANTSYGNWYLNDGTGEIYIYGTVNASGSYDWESFDIEVGDEVTVEGRSVLYNNTTLEFIDALWISTNKSLIKVASTQPENAVIPIEGGEFSVTLENKGNGISVEVPEEVKSWISLVSIGGTTSNPVVTFRAEANPGIDRPATLTFITHNDPDPEKDEELKEYSISADFTQDGVITDVKVEDLDALADGLARYRLQGTLSQDEEGDIYLTDYTGNALVYEVVPALDEDGEELDAWESLGVEVGDVVSLVARKSSYKNDPQLVAARVEEVVLKPTAATVAEFLAAAEDDTWYLLRGEVSDLTNTKYGNFDLVDETGSVYTYGLETGYGYDGSSSQGQFASLDVAAGDTLTIVGRRSSYKGEAQVADAFFVKVDKKAVELPDDLAEKGTADDPYSVASALKIFEVGAWTVYSSESAYFKGTVTEIEDLSTSYGNATFFISADGSADGDQLYIFRSRYLDDEKFTSEDQLQVGDEVVICGNMQDYNGTFEITNGYIHSLNR